MKTVCVTGASGFVGSWLVKMLLERGYTVKASVRDLDDAKHLLTLEGAKERLQVFKPDLLEKGSFDAAIRGCDGVFHVANPLSHHIDAQYQACLDPIKTGIHNILNACIASPTAKKIVLTSAVMLVDYNQTDVFVDDSQTTGLNSREWRMCELVGNAMSEEFASSLARINGIEMVPIIVPCMAIGPILGPRLTTGIYTILKYVQGAETFGNFVSNWIDVRDAAKAHILAFENPSSGGRRYCLVQSSAHHSRIVQMLQELYPSAKFPQKCADEKPFEPEQQTSHEDERSLGLEYTPLKQSLKDTVESLCVKQ